MDYTSKFSGNDTNDSLDEAFRLMVQKHRESGITDVDLIKRVAFPLTRKQTHSITGRAVYSYGEMRFDLNNEPVVRRGELRVRFLEPVTNRKGEVQRYSSTRNPEMWPFLPPTVNWRELLATRNPTIGITEGSRKALALTNAGLPCVGLQGVDCFGQKKRGVFLLDEIKEMGKANPDWLIVFDADLAQGNKHVRRALHSLMWELANA